jgi:hypothetical protein
VRTLANGNPCGDEAIHGIPDGICAKGLKIMYAILITRGAQTPNVALTLNRAALGTCHR